MDFITYTCKDCGGPAHPATGCQYTATYITCGPCTKRAWDWVKSHTNSKGARKGPNFYNHVNVIAPKWSDSHCFDSVVLMGKE